MEYSFEMSRKSTWFAVSKWIIMCKNGIIWFRWLLALVYDARRAKEWKSTMSRIVWPFCRVEGLILIHPRYDSLHCQLLFCTLITRTTPRDVCLSRRRDWNRLLTREKISIFPHSLLLHLCKLQSTKDEGNRFTLKFIWRREIYGNDKLWFS